MHLQGKYSQKTSILPAAVYSLVREGIVTNKINMAEVSEGALRLTFDNTKYGGFMLLLDKIIDVLSDLVVILPKKNRENRKEIREVVLSVQTEMERAIELAILYIDGTKRIIPKQELIVHLQGASSNLMSSYNEFKICAGLYGLADRFDEVFSSIKSAINVGQIKAVEDLIRDLANGESLVINGLRVITEKMYTYGNDLSNLSDDDFESKKLQVIQRLDLEVQSMRSQLNMFRKSVKEILKLM